MKISKIKEKIQNHSFLCIGAHHTDNILQLKKKYKFYRTNPVISKFQTGGVSSNIANNLSLFSQKVNLFSLSVKSRKAILNKNTVRYHNISNTKNDSFYTAIIDNDGKLLLGLASNETYERLSSINFEIINKCINKNSCFILDLCFNNNLIHKIIKYYHKKKVKIMIAGTSLFKIHRIKNSLNMITALSLNEDEVIMLSNKKTIKESINYIINKNPKISLVITRGNKPVIMVKNKIKYRGLIPKIKIKNENGAGDAFTAMFFLCLVADFEPTLTLSLSITLGCLKVMDYRYKNLKDYDRKFQHIFKKIKIIKI